VIMSQQPSDDEVWTEIQGVSMMTTVWQGDTKCPTHCRRLQRFQTRLPPSSYFNRKGRMLHPTWWPSAVTTNPTSYCHSTTLHFQATTYINYQPYKLLAQHHTSLSGYHLH